MAYFCDLSHQAAGSAFPTPAENFLAMLSHWRGSEDFQSPECVIFLFIDVSILVMQFLQQTRVGL